VKTEFSIFRVTKGKEARAKEWLQVLTDRRDECIDTLEREAMFYESVFKAEYDQRLYLAWFSVQGDVHESLSTSNHDIDLLHQAFWEECIEHDWKSLDMDHVVSFAPAALSEVINKLDHQVPSKNDAASNPIETK